MDEVQRIGRELVLAFVSALRTLQTHGGENEAVRTVLERFHALLDAQIAALGFVQIDAVDGMLLLNGTRLRAAGMQLPQFSALAFELTSRGVGGIAFRERIDVATLRGFCALFVTRPESSQHARALREVIFRSAPPGIVPLEPRTMTTTLAQDTVRASTMAFAIKAYASTIIAFREFVTALRSGRSPYTNRLNVIRVVQDLIDAAYSRADLLLFAVQLEKARGARAGLGYMDVHAANTCVYAVLMGRVLELERTMMLDLGTSALLADAAPAMVLDESAAANAGVLSPEQRAALQAEMARAVKTMLGEEAGNDDAVMMRTIVAYERQRPFAASGPQQRALHTLSRLVAVAGAFDAMTSDRPWRPAMTMRDALETLTREAGSKYDPLIVGTLHALLDTYFSRARAASVR